MTLLPQIVRLTPSSYADFLWCRRLHFTANLLRVPPSDSGRSSDQGLLVHSILEQLHRTGRCNDDINVTTTLAAHNSDTPQMRAFVNRHSRRCPSAVDGEAHEIDCVRLFKDRKPMFMASARVDAVWIHDGILDVRDYKTGSLAYSRLADDPRARVQAWVMARYANRRGLRLQLRYEYLQPEIDEDPEPWEPGDDDLEAITNELCDAVDQMWLEDEWRGVNDADVCRTCRYRSICRDSAAVGEPAWPVLSLAHE